MRAGQKLIGSNGKQVALFPLEYLYMTQDEGGDYSHLGTYNIDLIGYNGSSVITHAPIYAPCDMKCVDALAPTLTGGNFRMWQSTDTVNLPDGSVDYLCILFGHDDNPPYSTGAVVSQGDLIGRTGTTGYATGDHTHSCCGKGTYQGLVQRSTGNWDLANRIHYWEGVYVNDTPIIVGYGHDWKTYNGGHQPDPPTDEKKRKFPWAIAIPVWYDT